MLPNVSAIYRDLAFMANPNLQSKPTDNMRSSYGQDLFKQKQLRHNQLMEKLRNAQRESSYLNQQLRGTDTSYPNNSSRGSYSSYQTNQQGHNYNINTNFFENQKSNQSGNGWKPPNIRYRHIQDRKQPQIIQQTVNYANENKAKQRLQKQFYENQQRQNEQMKESNKNEVVFVNERRNKDQQNNLKIEEASESSYGKTWMNRQSKFQDKLQSYYDLCRKRPASRKADLGESEQTNKAKFIRVSGNRPTGIQLQKAMKLLSLD